MATVAVDSCVLLGLIHTDDDLHDASFDALLAHYEAGDQFVLSAIVLAEALVKVTRFTPGRVSAVRSLLGTMCGPVRVVDDDVAIEAARLRPRHKSLRLGDALVIATGLVDDVETVLTADKGLARFDERVKVL